MTDCNEFPAIDERSQRLDLPLPHPANSLLIDVVRLREALTKIDEQVVARNDQTSLRIPYTKNLTIYVRANGSDSNNGLTVAKAKATIHEAVSAISNYDVRGHAVTIDIGPGSFAGADISVNGVNGGAVSFVGAGIGKTIVTSMLNLHGFSCDIRGMSIYYLRLVDGAIVSVGNVDFNGTGNGGVAVGATAGLTFNGPITFSGQFISYFIHASDGGVVMFGAQTITFAPRASAAYGFGISRGSTINLYTCTFVGSYTGRAYNIYQGGKLTGQSGNSKLTSIPSSLPGILGNNGALEAAVGSARAGGVINGTTGALTASFGHLVATTARTGVGAYTLTFNETAANVTPQVTTTGTGFIRALVSSTQVAVATYNSSGVATDSSFTFTLFQA